MKKESRGVVLVTTLLTLCVLIIIALPYVVRVATEYKLMTKMYNSAVALDVAEAGIERAIWEISAHKAYLGWPHTNDVPNNIQTWSVTNNAFNDPTGKIVGYCDLAISLPITPADSTNYTVISTSYVPTKAAWDEKKSVTVTYFYTASNIYHFGSAIAAAGPSPSITMSGNARTDSYDSTIGPYNSPLQTDKSHGDIQTNGPITLSGNAYVNGNANPGPGYPFSGKPPVSGSYATLSAPISVPSIPDSVMATAQSTNNNSNITITSGSQIVPYTGGTALSVSGSNTLYLAGGTYYFTSMSVSGNAQIVVNGPSIIYVNAGNISVSGNGIVNNGSPQNLGIYSTGSSVNLSGNAAYVGTVYAPVATVTLSGNENFYGSIVCGKSIDSGNASIHFDVALRNFTPPFGGPPPSNRATSWVEQ